MPAVDLWKDCPGYSDATKRESEIRETCFLGLPERVCGVDCAPLTLRRVQWLTMINSPFLGSCPAEVLITKPGIESDIFLMLWICSSEFEAGNKRKQAKCFKRLKPIGKLDAMKAIKELQEYVDEAWLDSGEGSRDRTFYSTAASVTAFFRRNYGLPVDVWENSFLRNLVRKITGQVNPMDIPMKIIWQLIRAHANSVNPDSKFTNRISDPVMFKWLKNMNAKNQ